MSKKIETRNGIGEIRRVDAGSRLVEGYAVVFDSWSQDLGGFREKISRTAFDGGVLEINVSQDGSVIMKGPAEIVYDGEIL